MQLRDTEAADRRYTCQARWSRQLREYIFRNYLTKDSVSVLEVGSGTGAVLQCILDEFGTRTGFTAGIDINVQSSVFASDKGQTACYCAGAGEALPLRSDFFDLVFCHYLLLWVRNGEEILREMKRVAAPGGICVALAEPCYTEMKAFPPDLEYLALMQRRVLAEQGADLSAGKKIGELFSRAGFKIIEYGKYGNLPADSEFLKTETAQMCRDTGIGSFTFDSEKVYHYEVPTYYAIAKKRQTNEI